MTTGLADEVGDMVKRKTTPVRLSEEAIDVARIASGYTGESMAEYLSRIAVERGNEDIERLHERRKGGMPPRGTPAVEAEPPAREPRRVGRTAPADRAAAMARLADGGMSQAEIGRKFGISQSSVSVAIARHRKRAGGGGGE